MRDEMVALPPGSPALWEQVFVLAPLVIVGTLEPDGEVDLAPKHQATPLGWSSYYGFVCTDRHRTHENAIRTGEFTVSFPRPEQIMAVSQSAAPRFDGEKSALAAVATTAAREVEGVVLEDALLTLECRLDRVVEGFDGYDLIVGSIVAASAPREAIRDPDRDDAEIIHANPPLAYLCPTRFAAVSNSLSFPFPADFTR